MVRDCDQNLLLGTIAKAYGDCYKELRCMHSESNCQLLWSGKLSGTMIGYCDHRLWIGTMF